jgi:hypothetical protein
MAAGSSQQALHWAAVGGANTHPHVVFLGTSCLGLAGFHPAMYGRAAACQVPVSHTSVGSSLNCLHEAAVHLCNVHMHLQQQQQV